MSCPKKDTCLNYNIKCDSCHANSDIYNHYPLYKDRDLVEVVRCKDCKWWKDKSRCCNVNGLNNIVYNGDWFCRSGERREEDA